MNTHLSKKLMALSLISLVGILSGCASSNTSESTGQYFDDSMITAKVKSALIGDKKIKSGNIDVTTFKGIVQLSGFVNTPEQVLSAGQDASKVPGVVKVENDLIVK